MEKKHLMITGSSGFLGSRLVQRVKQLGYAPKLPVRKHGKPIISGIHGATDWSDCLKGCHTVIHLAARVHHMKERDDDLINLYREVNTQGTAALVEQAVRADVKRFIFVSTIKVLGEKTPLDSPFNDSSQPNPQDPYAVSKFEAEQIVHDSELDFVILRIPLVYGPGAKANLNKLVSWVDKGIPLPFGGVQNKRSLVGLDNFCDLLIKIIEYPDIVRDSFVVAEDLGVSLPLLISTIAEALKKPSRLWSVSPHFLQTALRVLGQGALIDRMLGSLSVDGSRVRSQFQWQPVLSFEEGISEMVQAYMQNNKVPSVLGVKG